MSARRHRCHTRRKDSLARVFHDTYWRWFYGNTTLPTDENGQAVLLISHNMESVFGLANRVVVLRHGRRVLDRRREDTTREEVVGLLTGAVRADATP